MKKIKATIVFSIFTPYPGTDTFEQCRELGLVDDTFDVSLYNHQSPENHFSAYIEKERFHELVRQAIKIVDRKNDIKKVLKVVSYMSDRGFMDTLKIVTRNVKGKILAR